MTAAIGDDGIDPSHFLPKNTSIINRFRDNKGDLDGVVETRTVEGKPVKVVTHAAVKDVSVLASLIERGFLEDHHRYYGFTLLELQHAFTSPMRHKVNAVFLDQLMGMPMSVSQGHRIYDEVTRDLTLSRVRIIVAACNDRADQDQACHLIEGIEVYRSCFERLVRALDDARRRLKDEQEIGLANDPMFR